ncbi:hypothetical protein [Demequina sp. NBRC 110055]|uniref:hypothetical protein n=1 Tax=Demequina sp. NBRC 110055 TaxID=1570344 RepID=UPI0011858710|nr:hypothetical protein [Demequina sp. NBRC 110055]
MRGRTRGVLGLLAAAMVPPAAAFAVGLVAIAVTLSACAPGGAAGPDGPIGPDDRLDLGSPGGVERLITDFTYYPACGNETLSVDGETWYPYRPANAAELPTSDPAPEPGQTDGAADADAATASAVWNAVVGAGAADVTPVVAAPAVVAPEPGQDEGVLAIYEGGLAHWTSNFGDLDTWLTSTPLDYAWVC